MKVQSTFNFALQYTSSPRVMLMHKYPAVAATPLAPLENLTVALRRHGLIPMFGILRGKSAPRARIIARCYGHAPSETMDILASKPVGTVRSAVVFIRGGGWISGSKGRGDAMTHTSITARTIAGDKS